MEALDFANILYDPGTRSITGLLDYEDCLGGDPLFEIMWMAYYFEHDDLEQTFFDFARFWSGYGELEGDLGRARLYQPFPYLDKLRWIPSHSERAQSYCERLTQGLLVESTFGVFTVRGFA